MKVTGHSRNAALLLSSGWLWHGENWRGCIHEVYWRDMETGEILQQRTAIQRRKARNIARGRDLQTSGRGRA
jgi:hypothetical protein